jgi:hypothetical protein
MLRRDGNAISSISSSETGQSLHNGTTHSHPSWKVIADKYDWSNFSDAYSRLHVLVSSKLTQSSSSGLETPFQNLHLSVSPLDNDGVSGMRDNVPSTVRKHVGLTMNAQGAWM